jgi:hypothetical protein
MVADRKVRRGPQNPNGLRCFERRASASLPMPFTLTAGCSPGAIQAGKLFGLRLFFMASIG